MILQAKNITKFFHDPETVEVLKQVDFAVEEGEFLSIVGKSGCGKSTLLYILSTMDTDYEGELDIKGKRLNGWSQNQLARFRNENLGFVFQFHFLLPEFTALRNVMMPALKLGKYSYAEIEQRAMDKLKMVEMEAFSHKMASKLSGGQQQRVAIARALVNDPAIIMGDEPTGNLDKVNSQRVFEIFQELARKNHQTIITVTHDQDFAAGSDRIIEMSDGQIIAG
ncbi:MAG TPA: ABC transporter ATP-binding protein [Haliscomenobacter sp.]|uniref:ABC transporter ATP-binding protein n=1 Tax=Haliscomenobacter sp. TaxID=2717303 RepID=UPI002C6D7ED8|nr:ABC transporter ATP-binding protein [Haliscomenobacter sp.]HOY17203.1 ABC transporter ATP-binding protein [Haliscomenobacter sp.]